MKKLLKKAWKKLVGVKRDENTEEVEITLNRARRRFLAKYLKGTKQYNDVKAKYLPHKAKYSDVAAMCHIAGVDIHYLLDVV